MNLLSTPTTRDVLRPYQIEVAESNNLFITPQEAKGYARVDGDVEDSLFEILIRSAQRAFEEYTGKLLDQREVTAKYQVNEYESLLYLPYLPVVEVTDVTEGDWELKGYRIELDSNKDTEVTYTAGLVPDGDHMPADIKLGCLKWIASNYDDREDTYGGTVSKMPNGSKYHWNRYKTMQV